LVIKSYFKPNARYNHPNYIRTSERHSTIVHVTFEEEISFFDIII